MADDNPPIGGDLSEIKAKLTRLQAEAAETRAAVQGGRARGTDPTTQTTRREVEKREATVSRAANTRAGAEDEAAKAANDAAAATRRGSRATQAEVSAAESRATASRRLAALEAQYARALSQRVALTGPQTRVLDQLQHASRQNPFYASGSDTRPTTALASQGLARQQASGAYALTEAGRRAANPAAVLSQIDDSRRQLAALVAQEVGVEQRTVAAVEEVQRASSQRASAERQAAVAVERQAALFDTATVTGANAPAGQMSLLGTGGNRIVYGPGRNVTPLGGGAGGGGGTPPPTATGGAGEDPERLSRATAAYREAGQGVQYFTSKVEGSQNALRRHGALTTEFIEAAARGEASYREWGYQIGATAGKFAGWTAVSIPVFAALDGIRQIGAGAIASASGVNQLQRVMDNVNGDEAQAAFRDLSRQFNVPIETASRAVYLAGQRFHNLTDAVNAARASLFAFKTGELDVDQATQSLNAVAAGFGLKTGVAVKDTFEQINQAQNQLGASIPDLVSGLAKAGGAFKNAGGDVTGLITLISSGRLAAGRTGDQVATAVQRSAGYYLRPSNQAALRGYGINPNQAFYSTQGSSVLGQAVDVTRKLLSQGREQDVQKLAAALSSPQFASIFVPILRASAQGTTGALQNIAPIVSPEASRQSAESELRVLLRSPVEQFKSFGYELQRFGSSLGQSGIVRAASETAAGLGLLLGAVDKTVGAFNRVPSALTAATTLLGVGLASRAVGRRVGFGEEGGALRRGLFGRTDEQNSTIALNQAVREQGNYLQEQSRGFAVRNREAQLRKQVTAGAVDEFEQPGTAGRLGLDAEQYEAQRVKLRQVAVNAELAAEELAVEMRVLDQLARTEAELATSARAAIRNGEAAAYTRDNNIYVRNRSPLAAGENPQLLAPTGTLAQARARAVPRQSTFRESGLPSGVAVTQYMKQVEQQTDALSSGFRRVGTGLLNVGRSLKDALGGLGLAIIGIDAAVAVGEAIKAKEKKLADQDVALGADPKGAQDAAARIAAARAIVPNGDLRRAAGNIDAYSSHDQAIISSGYAEQQRQQINSRLRASGKAGVNLRSDEITADYQRVLLQSGEQRIDAAQTVLKELDTADVNVSESFKSGIRDKLTSALRGGQRQTGALSRTLLRDVSTIDVKGLGTDLDTISAFIQTGHAKIADVQEFFAEGIAELAAGAPGKNASYHQRIAYESRLKQFTDTIEATARQTLQDSLDTAVTQQGRQNAYDTYYTTLSRADDRVQGQIKASQARAKRLQAQLAKTNANIGPTATPGATSVGPAGLDASGNVLQQNVGDDYGTQVARRDDLEEAIKRNSDNRAKLRRALKTVQDRIKKLSTEMRRADFQDEDQFAEAHASVDAYNYAPGIDRDSATLRSLDDRIDAAIKAHMKGSLAYLQLIQQRDAQREQVVQDQLDLIAARGNLRTASITDPTAKAKATIGNLQDQLAFAQEHNLGDKAIIDLQTQIAQARTDLAQQAAQEAQDLIAAQFELQESKTDDPVKQAQIELQAARAKAKDPSLTAAEKLRAQADVNNKAKALRDANLSDKEDTIDFNLSMERISTQDAIDQYEALLKVKNLGKAQRRQILQRVHDLKAQQDQESGSFDLDVGSIKMPTVYDVRRAFAPIRNGIRAAQQSAPQVIASYAQQTTGDATAAGRIGANLDSGSVGAAVFNITVNDVNAASEVYHAIDRAMKTNVKAKMKSRGHR